MTTDTATNNALLLIEGILDPPTRSGLPQTERLSAFEAEFGLATFTQVVEIDGVEHLDLKTGIGFQDPEGDSPTHEEEENALEHVKARNRTRFLRETIFLEVKIEEVEVYRQAGVPDQIFPVSSSRRVVSIHPTEPSCYEGVEHDWQSPHSLVGGLEENPGVFSSGPGIRIHEVCMSCGTSYHKDEGATNPIEAGYCTKITYVPSEFPEEVVALRRKGKKVACMDPRKTQQGGHTVHSLHEDLVDAMEGYSEDDGFWFAFVDANTVYGEEMQPDEYEKVEEDEIAEALIAAAEQWEEILELAKVWGSKFGGTLGETWNSASGKLEEYLADHFGPKKISKLTRSDEWDDIHNTAVAAFVSEEE